MHDRSYDVIWIKWIICHVGYVKSTNNRSLDERLVTIEKFYK